MIVNFLTSISSYLHATCPLYRCCRLRKSNPLKSIFLYMLHLAGYTSFSKMLNFCFDLCWHGNGNQYGSNHLSFQTLHKQRKIVSVLECKKLAWFVDLHIKGLHKTDFWVIYLDFNCKNMLGKLLIHNLNVIFTQNWKDCFHLSFRDIRNCISTQRLALISKLTV